MSRVLVEFLPFKIKLSFSTDTGGENVNTSELTNILSEYFDDFLTNAFPDEDDMSSTDIGDLSYAPFSHVSLLSMPGRRRQLVEELDQDRISLDGFFVDDDDNYYDDMDFYGDITQEDLTIDEGVNDGNHNHNHNHKYHQNKWISWSSLTSPLRNLKSMPKEEDYNDTRFQITRIKPGNLRGRGLNGNGSTYEVSRRYSGVAIFTRENNLPIPSVNMLQAQQLSAQADVDNLKERLQMSESETLNQVADVEIGVHMNNNSNTGNGNGDGYSGTNGGQTNPALVGGGITGTTGTNAVIVIAVAVAACSMCLLGFALYLAFRRRQTDETVPTNQHQHHAGNGQLQMKEMSTPRYGHVADNDFSGDLHGRNGHGHGQSSSSNFITPKDGSQRHRQSSKGQRTSPRSSHQKHQSLASMKMSAAPPVVEMHMHPHHDDAISEYTESVYSVTGGGSSVKSRLSVSQHKHHQQRRQMLQDAAALESQNGGLSQKDAKVSNRFNPRYIISAATSKRSRSNASASSSDEADMSMADFCGASYNETPGKGQSLGSGIGLGIGPGRGASQEMEGVPQLTTPMKEALMMQTSQLLGQSHTQSYSMSIDTPTGAATPTPTSPLSGISNDVRDKAVAKLNTGSTSTTPLSTSTSTNSNCNGNVDVDSEIAALSGIVSSPRSKAKYSPSGLYPADVIDNDITSSLAEYSKGTSIGKHFRKLLGENNDDSSTIAGNTITNLLGNGNGNTDNNDAHDGGASVSSYESYGFSLDGADYSTVANSTKYGY